MDGMWQIGMTVEDIDAACEDLGRAFGWEWTRAERTIDVVVDGEPLNVTLQIAIARQGPSYLELIQGIEGTPWWPPHGFDHIAFWAEDLQACLLNQAHCLRPDNDPQATDWALPAELCARASVVARQLEDHRGLARALLLRVQCLREGELAGPRSDEQQALLDEALQVLGEADPELRLQIEAWQTGTAAPEDLPEVEDGD